MKSRRNERLDRCLHRAFTKRHLSINNNRITKRIIKTVKVKPCRIWHTQKKKTLSFSKQKLKRKMINKQGNNHGLNAWSPPLEIIKQWIICNFTTFFLSRPIAQFIFFHSLTINRITMIFLYFFGRVFPFYFFNYQKVLRFLSHHHSIWSNRFEISLLKAIGNDSTCVSIGRKNRPWG